MKMARRLAGSVALAFSLMRCALPGGSKKVSPASAKAAANWVTGEFSRLLNQRSASGLRADADLMVWWHASSAEALQEAYTRLRRTALGRHLEPVWSQMALHRPAEFNRSHLPAFLAGWDVCLLPFAINESTRYISPTKILEYMAADRLIVSTPITDVAEPYGDIVFLGAIVLSMAGLAYALVAAALVTVGSVWFAGDRLRSFTLRGDE